jgi:hypothetical protein
MGTSFVEDTRVVIGLIVEGESKQEAKTLAAIDAIRVLETKALYKHEMMCLLQRLVKKVSFQDEQKVRHHPANISSVADILQ